MHKVVARVRSERAWRTLVLGLACFAAWLLLDAPQLYRSALASPIGVRRSVALTLLRPIARVDGLTHVGGVVNTLDSALGRMPAAPVLPVASPRPSAPIPRVPGVAPYDIVADAVAGRPFDPSDVPTAPVPLVALAPSATHPITVLSIGDSLGEDLGIGLGDVIGQNPAVHVVQAARQSTGLADTAYYDWAKVLRTDLARDHPQIVVMMVGANDWQEFPTTSGREAVPGTHFWRRRYGDRVATIMREVRATGAHLVWVGLPVFGSASPFPPSMSAIVNGVFRREVRAHPGVSFFSTYRLFMDSAHGFSTYLPDAAGALVEVRATDGVHFTEPYGDDELGADLVRFIASTLHVSLAPTSGAATLSPGTRG